MIPLLPYDNEDEEVESPSWLTDHSASPEEIAEQRVLSRDVHQALNRLPASYRTIINLVSISKDWIIEKRRRHLALRLAPLKAGWRAPAFCCATG
jgi:hypothetical protein